MEQKNIGALLKEARTQKGYTLEEMGKKFGKSRQYIHKIETGGTGISRKKMFEMSKVLDLPLEKILMANYLQKAS